jgi:gamma-glutamylcyclotransferase (GGCT)/AIG2-like uncharacterized protein YtfP
MPQLFTYVPFKQMGLSKKGIGNDAIEILVEEAVLHGFRTEQEGEFATLVQDPRSIVLGKIVQVSDEEIKSLDEFNTEYNRTQVQIDEYTLQIYVLKSEYAQLQHTVPPPKMTEAEKTEFLATAMTRYTDICDHTDQMRAEFVDDIKFKAGMQWPESSAQERQRDQRPMQTINRIDSFINIVVNQGLQNTPGVRVRPVDSVTDPATADVISGIIRHILNQGDSKSALDTAYDYAVSGGFGYFRALTDYCDDDSFDQEIRIDRVENPCSVYFPLHTMKTLDFADAPYCFVRQKMSKADFKKKYPDKVDDFKTFDVQGVGDDRWTDKDNIYLAEYFVVEDKIEKLYLLPGENGEPPAFSTEIPKDVTPLQERDVCRKEINWYLITQFEILESRKLPGKIIPIFPIVGKESIVDGIKHYISLTRYLKEPQKMLNFWYSAFTEIIANAPKAPFLVEENQITGYKEFWDNANKPLPYLPYKATDLKGNQVPPPSRITPPEVGTAILSGIQYAGEFMKDVSGLHDASMGATSNERTGKAIQARANQGALATYHFVNSYERAIRSLGNYLVDVIPVIYDTPRVLRIVGEDMTDRVIQVNQVHKDLEDNDRLYDLTVGKYSVIVTSGPNYDTRRQETQDMLGMLMQTAPQLSMVLIDIFAQVSDIPGSDKIVARMKKFLNMTYPGLLDQEELGTPEQQLKAQVQQMTGDIQKLMQQTQVDDQQKQQLSQMLQQAQQQLQDKSAEISARLQVQHMKTQADAYKAQLDLVKEQLKQQGASHAHGLNAAVKIAAMQQPSTRSGETVTPEESESGPYYGTANFGANIPGNA